MSASNGRSGNRRTGVSVRRVATLFFVAFACFGCMMSLLFGGALLRGVGQLFSPAQIGRFTREIDGRTQQIGTGFLMIADVATPLPTATPAPTAVIMSTTLASMPELTTTVTVTPILRFSKPTTPASVEVAARLANERRKNNPAPTEAAPVLASVQVVSPTQTPLPAPTAEPLLVSPTSKPPCVRVANDEPQELKDLIRNISFVKLESGTGLLQYWDENAKSQMTYPLVVGDNVLPIGVADKVQAVTLSSGSKLIAYVDMSNNAGAGISVVLSCP